MKNILFKPKTYGVVFSLYFCVFLVYANIQKPRLLILHSYDKDYAWTRDVSIGIRRVLDIHSDYSIKWHYMDTKRRANSRYKQTAASAALSLIERWEPHVVIAIDDNAQDLVVKKFVNKKNPQIQIVFSGVNAAREKYNYVDAENVTGILERLELNSINSMIREIVPKKNIRIGLITDESSTSTLVHEEVKSFNWDSMQLSLVKAAPTFDDWQAAIIQANKEVDILLFTNYHTVACTKNAGRLLSVKFPNTACNKDNEQVVPPGELIKWTMDNTKLPNIGGWGFFVEDGGMISIGVSPYEQGEEAAKMAVDIIENKKIARDIPHKKTQQFITYARKSEMDKAGFNKLPEVYEAFARATKNYYE